MPLRFSGQQAVPWEFFTLCKRCPIGSVACPLCRARHSRVPGTRKPAEWAEQIIRVMDGKPLLIDAQNWQSYHAAAVMACNYQVTLVDAALELMENAGVNRATALAALEPLIRTTTENILLSGPEAALTGPIRRGDSGTIRQTHDGTRRVLRHSREICIRRQL